MAAGGGVLNVEGSSPVYAITSVPVDEKYLNDVLGWVGDVGNRNAGGVDAGSTSDDQGFPPILMIAPVAGVRVGVDPSLVAACKPKVFYLGTGGEDAPGEGSVCDGICLNCSAGDSRCLLSLNRGAGWSFIAPLHIVAAAQACALVFVEMTQLVYPPVESPRRCWHTGPFVFTDTSGAAPPLIPLC